MQDLSQLESEISQLKNMQKKIRRPELLTPILDDMRQKVAETTYRLTEAIKKQHDDFQKRHDEDKYKPK
jgi:hypothetical protein